MMSDRSTTGSWKRRPDSSLAVTVQSVAGRPGEYLASLRSDPLDATFSVYFRDNLAGALALHSFADMVRFQYGVSQVRLELTDQAVVFKSQAVLDVLVPGRRSHSARRG
jgi:hypothetical protein